MNPAQYDAWYDSPLGAACLESEIALPRRGAGELAAKDILEVGCGAAQASAQSGRQSRVDAARRELGLCNAG